MYDSHTMNLNHLRYFYEVARAGNMRRAATRIGISQPALSKQIQALEDTIGLQLFYRTPKGLQPTADGEVAYQHCEKIFGHLRDLEMSLEARRKGSAGRLTIGVITSISTHILPGYVRRYRESYDKVRIKIVTVKSRAVLRALEEHKVDIGLVAEQPPGEQFVWRPFAKTPLVIVAAPSSALATSAKDGPVAAEQLHKADMVAFDPPAPTRRVTDRYLAARGLEPRIMAECPSIDTIKELVAERVGFAVLPQHCIEAEVTHGRLVQVPVADWSLERTLYLVHLAGPPLPPTVRHFADLFPTLTT
ncbi:MAG: LysR family transcriptional regulator [Deltaproteobacteria bacterium]|nr:LysR family transcriptional regulator [Deltaproteobacteria bacterium]